MSPSAEEWSKIHLKRHPPLSKEANNYLQYLKKNKMAARPLARRRCELRRLQWWLESKNQNLSELTPSQLESEFPQWCAKTYGYPKHHCDTQFYSARTFVIWLIRNGRLPHRKATDFYPGSLKSFPLPKCTMEFIEQRKKVSKHAPRRYLQLFNLFHQWLSERQIELSNLKYHQVQSFLNFLDKRGYKPKPLHVRRLHMRIYLDWLKDRELIKCDCRDLFGTTSEQYRNFELPDFTEEYLAELATHLSPDTIVSYKTGICGFHRFLKRDGVTFSKLNRRNCVHWMEWMFEKDYSASTRLQRIVIVKGYLSWVVDRRIHRFDVEHLLRSDDLPQLDDLLPRPLPAAVDQEIQRRLCASQDVYLKGALLLRYTGLRLGDLERLAFNPIQKDEKGRSFLLVPPGKIRVERLIPIESRTIALIKEIQNKIQAQPSNHGADLTRATLFAGKKKKSSFHKIYRRFKKMTGDLETFDVGSIYPHRLRHTYATTLLTAGLHPAVLMVLLGHTDLAMTFRYAKVSPELVHRAYFTAYDQIQKGIQFPTPHLNSDISAPADPVALLHAVAKWIKKQKSSTADTKTSRILNRLQKLTYEIETLKSQM